MMMDHETKGSAAPSVTVPTGGLNDIAAMPLERIEEEMRTLAGHIAAATCAFLVLVGEYDAREGWSEWEALSCAHWLNWRCGVGMTAAREQVRVARALRDLPVVRAAFAAGELSYSKVRAITRVAHANNETELVRLAQAATAAQLERAMSALRRCTTDDDPATSDGELSDAEDRAEAQRSLYWYTDDSGDLIAKIRIPAGRSSETFLAAVEPRIVPTAPGDEPEALDARRLDALLDALAAGTSVESTLAPQPEIIVHYTIVQPDPTSNTSGNEERNTDPASPPAGSSAESSADSSGPVGRIDLSGSTWPINTARGTQLSTAAFEAMIDDAGIRAVLDLIDDNRDIVTSMDLGRHKRTPSRELRRAVMRRDGHCCRFPGCPRRYRLDIHHIRYWKNGGRTDLDNLIALCPKHHSAIHKRHWTLTGTATNCTFTRPDDTPADPRAARLNGSLAHLVEQHRLHGLDIAADGAGSHWAGDHIDWECFFAAFANGPLATPPRKVE